jgi:hypothetical protein
VHLDEDVLCHVLHPQAACAHSAPHQLQDAAPVSIEQIAERLRIAARVRAQQPRIRIGVVGCGCVAISQS